MSAGHRQIEHTADIAVELWADSEAELLGEGARALVLILTGDALPAAEATRTVSVESIDPADRLVQWLNEVLYLATVHGFVVAGAEFELSPSGLSARVTGATQHALAVEIKSATYHDLEFTERDGQWRARVVLDV